MSDGGAPASARRVSVAASRLRRWLAGYAQNHPRPRAQLLGDVVEVTSPDGACAWIAVPFAPLAPVGPSPTDNELLAVLVEHVEVSRRIGVLLVRRGGHAAGIFQGSELVASKVGSSYVQGTTKAGGWSQKRYSRRRDNQSREAFDAAADAAARVFADPTPMDAVVLGGDRGAVDAVLADPRLRAVAPLVTGPLLAVADPRLRVLQQTPEQFLAVTIRLVP